MSNNGELNSLCKFIEQDSQLYSIAILKERITFLEGLFNKTFELNGKTKEHYVDAIYYGVMRELEGKKIDKYEKYEEKIQTHLKEFKKKYSK